MKKGIKIACASLLAVGWALAAPLPAQPEAALPSEQAWQAIQNSAELPSQQLPSETAYAGLRAERPTEVPIGGIDAPVPQATGATLIAFALAAIVLKRRKLYQRKEFQGSRP
jgi:hypothetical protein